MEWQQVPAQVWVLISAVLTATITLLGVALNNHSNNRRLQLQLAHDLRSKDRDLRMERIEELYILAGHFATRFACTMLPSLNVMNGELTYNQALDIQNENLSTESTNFERIQAIVDIYFQELSTELAAVFAARDDANKIEGEFRARYKRGDHDGREFIDRLATALGLFELRSSTLRTRIAQVARRVSRAQQAHP